MILVEKMEKFSRRNSWGFAVVLLLALALFVFAFWQFNSQKREGIDLQESFKAAYQPILLNHSDGKGFSFSYPQGYYIEQQENSSSYVIWAGEPPLLEVISVAGDEFLSESEINAIKNTFNSSEIRKFEKTTVNGKIATLLYAFINESGVSGFHRQGFVQCSNVNSTAYTVVVTGVVPEALAPDAILVDAMIQSVRC